MYIFDIENKSNLNDVLLENLKWLGVRCRPPKKLKENEKENVYSEHQVFQKPLRLLKKCSAFRLDGSSVIIPEFLSEACGVIEKEIRVEGIFRKAGSTCKQKERKMELNQGKKLNCEYHVLDACSLVKLFFRELPQPLIPYSYHEIFLKALMLSTYEKELDALMLACLLLPEENLATLAFFMEFLLKVSQHSEKNKMNMKNLAIILTPTLMPLSKETRASNNIEMAHHFKVIEMLIENAERIGVVPNHILMSISSVTNKKPKKKRRSGSITRMFTGLKKIVGSRSSTFSELDDSVASRTPENVSSLGKRKSGESNSTLSLSAKKKRLSDSAIGYLTPVQCRMYGYVTSVAVRPSLAPKRSCSQLTKIHKDQTEHSNSAEKVTVERRKLQTRTSRLNLVGRYISKKQKSQTKLNRAISGDDLPNPKSVSLLETNLNADDMDEKRKSLSVLQITEEENVSQDVTSEKGVVRLSDSELITVHKSEYEDIKNRVSALEEDLELLTSVHSVQYAYEKAKQESERLNETSSDQLAKILKKELRIRTSSENQVVRSPSARRIGSCKRRSRELVQRNSDPRSNLKRGRPNTVLTGLPSPRLRTMSNENTPVPVAKQSLIKRSATFRSDKEEWESGETFFAKEHLLRKISPTSQRRPSLAEIRYQNAGMVLEKAKLFNSLTETKEVALKIPRRQSIRLENLRRLNEADKRMLTRTRSLGSEKKAKSSPLAITENTVVHTKGSKDQREVIHSHQEVLTPKSHRFHTPIHTGRRDTPSIKKSLVTRSPRNFAKTPGSQVRSTVRTRATPLKVLPEVGGTPRLGLRRSPRFLARTINMPRLKD
ncbi:hypothetical protein RUM43_007144 [Polyplax serrata]|uniref:Rho-GAP domain-containing protein n=1 Tax=Polyplax serrata TaxID=468196 RepID=A0AAN8P1G2_POLSC